MTAPRSMPDDSQHPGSGRFGLASLIWACARIRCKDPPQWPAEVAVHSRPVPRR